MVLAAIIDEGETAHWEPEPGRSWNEVMESYARTTRGGLLAAGGWIRFATPRLVLGVAQLRAMDGLVERLRASGFSINDATHAYAFLFQVVLASIGSADAPVMEMHRALMTELEAVGADALTTLREVVLAAAKISPDAQFEYDLDCALRGIAERSGVRLDTSPAGEGGGRRPPRHSDS